MAGAQAKATAIPSGLALKVASATRKATAGSAGTKLSASVVFGKALGDLKRESAHVSIPARPSRLPGRGATNVS